MTNVKTELLESIQDLKAQAAALEEIQLALESLRDEALNKREFFNGFSTCAEHMIKIVVGKAQFLKDEAQRKFVLQKEEEEAKIETLPEKPKKPTKKKPKKKKS